MMSGNSVMEVKEETTQEYLSSHCDQINRSGGEIQAGHTSGTDVVSDSSVMEVKEDDNENIEEFMSSHHHENITGKELQSAVLADSSMVEVKLKDTSIQEYGAANHPACIESKAEEEELQGEQGTDETENDTMNLVEEMLNASDSQDMTNDSVPRNLSGVVDPFVESLEEEPVLGTEVETTTQDMVVFHLDVCEAEVVIDLTEVVDVDISENQEQEQEGESLVIADTDHLVDMETVQSHVTTEQPSPNKKPMSWGVGGDSPRVLVLPATTFPVYSENSADQPINIAVNNNFTFEKDSPNKDENYLKERQFQKSHPTEVQSTTKKRKVKSHDEVESNCTASVIGQSISHINSDSVPSKAKQQCKKRKRKKENTDVVALKTTGTEPGEDEDYLELDKISESRDVPNEKCQKLYLNTNIEYQKKSGQKQFQCLTCEKYLLSKKMLQRHMVSCGKEKTHPSEEKGNFLCRICDFYTTESEIFSTHQRTHFVERCDKISKKFYTCDKCSYTCTVEKALVAHKKSKSCNNNRVMFSCKICGTDCTDTDALGAHMQLHRVDNGYMCDICGAEFFTTQKVMQHRRTHTNERPYKCDFCHYSCGRIDNLQTHIKRKHSKQDNTHQTFEKSTKFDAEGIRKSEGNKNESKKTTKNDVHVITKNELPNKVSQKIEKGIQKSLTGVYFGEVKKKSSKLSLHMSCKLCQIEFLSLAAKNEHMQQHKKGATGGRYKCELCEFQVKSISKLIEHIRVHTGVKPNKCKYCSYRCAKKDNLISHMKLKHCK
ncbi:uncharacterized protein LOC144438941 [Glandiceps talaboti]